ncbi:hypothetical protein WA158_003486 [Blastocystis sp. Blastoise]
MELDEDNQEEQTSLEEKDTRIKTHVVPIDVRCIDNQFNIHLSNSIDITKNIISYIDLNLIGSESVPLFDTFTKTQIFKYINTRVNGNNNVYTITLDQKNYSIPQLLELCHFDICDRPLISESPDIDSTVKIKKIPTITINRDDFYCEFYIAKTRRGFNFPKGTYTDIEFWWIAVCLVSSVWLDNKNRLMMKYDDDNIILYRPKTTSFPIPVRTTGTYSLKEYANNGVFSKFIHDIPTQSSDGTIQCVINEEHDFYFPNVTSPNINMILKMENSLFTGLFDGNGTLIHTGNKPEIVLQRIKNPVKHDDIFNIKTLITVEDGYNTMIVRQLSGYDGVHETTFTVPPGDYIEDEFYDLLESSINNTIYTDYLNISKDAQTMDNKDGYIIYLSCKGNDSTSFTFTATDIEHSLFKYRGALHNIRPDLVYDEQGCFAWHVSYGKQLLPDTPVDLNTLDLDGNYKCYTDSHHIDFSQAQELGEILGYNKLGHDEIVNYGVHNIDSSRPKGMLIAQSNIVDNSQNSLYSFNVNNYKGNNEFHDIMNINVSPYLNTIQDIIIRYTDKNKQYVNFNNNCILRGFLEFSDTVDTIQPSETIKKLCLNCLTADTQFYAEYPTLNIQNKILKDIIIQNDTDTIQTNASKLCTGYINGSYYPTFSFPLSDKYVTYSNINSPITIDHHIDLRFDELFKGNIICNICEPNGSDIRFKAYDEVYCDFSTSKNLIYELKKTNVYGYQYLTNIQIISVYGQSTDYLYPISLRCFTNEYENNIHVIDTTNLPYYYSNGIKYEGISNKINKNVYYCNRKLLKLLPHDNMFFITCDYPCVVLLTISYI